MNFKLPEKYSWVTLEDEIYNYALEKILFTHDNLNIIGKAGAGKSTLLKLATEMLTASGKNVVLLASTGIAAVNISSEGLPAVTLHSFFKIPPLDINPIETAHTIPELYPLMLKVDVIIIDEVSMVSSAMFDYIIQTILEYRNGNLARMPRIILFSDILQLAPVVKKDDKDVAEYYQQMYNGNIFFFNSTLFQELGFTTIQLEYIFRQKDKAFQDILNRIREGTQTNQDLTIINQYRIDECDYHANHELYMNIETTNMAVNKINEAYFHTFNTKSQKYIARISGSFKIDKTTPLQDIINIREEMQVMCLKNNWDAGYQNGSIGKVLEVRPESLRVKLDSGLTTTVMRERWDQYSYNSKSGFEPKLEGTFTQIGAKPCASITSWKSQGQTFSNVYFNVGHFTPEAVVYVSLSRLRGIEGLGLKQRIEHKHIKAHKEALEFLSKV